jgi:hypothetical protein
MAFDVNVNLLSQGIENRFIEPLTGKPPHITKNVLDLITAMNLEIPGRAIASFVALFDADEFIVIVIAVPQIVYGPDHLSCHSGGPGQFTAKLLVSFFVIHFHVLHRVGEGEGTPL